MPISAAAGDDTTPQASSSTDAVFQIHPLPDTENNGLLLRIEPPKQPQDTELSHVPCSIALVIDVSGSMGANAPVPGQTGEHTGLSVLDLVKHACRTIISTLDENDQLAIVTFSAFSKVLQPLIPMTADNKKSAVARIMEMRIQGPTNLWHGVKDGIKLFEKESNTGRVPAVMVLTDGTPNHLCPAEGYVPALKALGNIVPSVHTFGFGYTLRSGLLKSIAEFGRGNYSFIPDAGMIGTVFVHAVANLQSTFAADATMRLTYPDGVEIQQTAGPFVDQGQPVHRDDGQYQLTIPLGNLQYGQSRDIYLRWKSRSADATLTTDTRAPHIRASLHYDQMTETQHTITADCNLLDTSLALSAAEIAYHVSRHHICAFLGGLFPIDHLGEHRMAINRGTGSDPTLEETQAHLKQLIAALPAARFPGDPHCASLMQELTGPEPAGQTTLALSSTTYLTRWGVHYLPSLHGAHARQLCNSFKDPGPLLYGAASPLFVRCRDRLNAAFDSLPPPPPSIPLPRLPGGDGGGGPNAGIDPGDALRSAGMGGGALDSMECYNQASSSCFAASTPVRLAAGRRVPISALARGMRVVTPRGPRRVAAVLVTPVARAVMVRWRGVLVTPWHPIAAGAGTVADEEEEQQQQQGLERREWAFPCQLEDKHVVLYTGRIYSVLLQRDEDTEAHAIMLGGTRSGSAFWGVTLGHGMLRGSDPRAHSFFGNYDSVVSSLVGLEVVKAGKFCSGGVERSTKTGLVCGFKNGRPPRRLCSSISSSVLKIPVLLEK